MLGWALSIVCASLVRCSRINIELINLCCFILYFCGSKTDNVHNAVVVADAEEAVVRGDVESAADLAKAALDDKSGRRQERRRVKHLKLAV